MLQRLDLVLRETLFSMNVVSEYAFKVLYEWVSLALHQCQRCNCPFELAPEVWERLVQRMIDQLEYKGCGLKPSIERLMTQFMALPEVPRAALSLGKESIRGTLPEIHQRSKVAADFVVNCWTEAVVDKPPLATKMLTSRNVRLLFHVTEDTYRFLSTVKDTSVNKVAVYHEQERQRICAFFHSVQFLNYSTMYLSEDNRVDFFLAYEFEIAALVKSLPYLQNHEEAMYELILLLCAAVLIVDDAKPLCQERLVLERLLRLSHLAAIADQVERYAPEPRREAMGLLMTCLEDYIAEKAKGVVHV